MLQNIQGKRRAFVEGFFVVCVAWFFFFFLHFWEFGSGLEGRLKSHVCMCHSHRYFADHINVVIARLKT